MKRALIAVAAVLGFGFLAACDTASVSPNGQVWVFTPDIAEHRASGNSLIQFYGLCNINGMLDVRYTGWANVDLMVQGQTMIVDCRPGHATGGDNWGVNTRHA